jgi:hypothetical protein
MRRRASRTSRSVRTTASVVQARMMAADMGSPLSQFANTNCYEAAVRLLPFPDAKRMADVPMLSGSNQGNMADFSPRFRLRRTEASEVRKRVTRGPCDGLLWHSKKWRIPHASPGQILAGDSRSMSEAAFRLLRMEAHRPDRPRPLWAGAAGPMRQFRRAPRWDPRR